MKLLKIHRSFNFIKKFNSHFENKIVYKFSPKKEISLNRKNIFIFPNYQGVLVGFYIFLVLLGAMIYQLSLGYLFTFIVGVILLLSVFMSYYNFQGQLLALNEGVNTFVNSNHQIKLSFNNNVPIDSFGFFKSDPYNKIALNEKNNIIKVSSEKRGYFKPDYFVIESIYPFGIVRTWSVLRHDLRIIFYPKIKKLSQDQLLKFIRSNSPHKTGSIDFEGIKEYTNQDDPKKIIWSRATFSDDLLVKVFSDQVEIKDINIDYTKVPSNDHEERLSMMAFLIDWSHANNYRFKIVLENNETEMSKGISHYHHCMELISLTP